VLFSSAKVIPKVNLIVVGFLLSHSPHELFLISGIYTFVQVFSPFGGHIFAPSSVKATNLHFLHGMLEANLCGPDQFWQRNRGKKCPHKREN